MLLDSLKNQNPSSPWKQTEGSKRVSLLVAHIIARVAGISPPRTIQHHLLWPGSSVLISHSLRAKERRNSQTGDGKVPLGIPALYPMSVQGWACAIMPKTPGNARFRLLSDLVIACTCGWSHDTVQAWKPHLSFSRITAYPSLFYGDISSTTFRGHLVPLYLFFWNILSQSQNVFKLKHLSEMQELLQIRI